MILTWEALGGILTLVIVICGGNVFATRAIIRQELERHVRPLGECVILHKEIDSRLGKLENAG